MTFKATDINGVPCISTGTINSILGFAAPVSTLTSWGVTPFGKIKAGVYWKVSDLPTVIDGAITHFNNLKERL